MCGYLLRAENFTVKIQAAHDRSWGYSGGLPLVVLKSFSLTEIKCVVKFLRAIVGFRPSRGVNAKVFIFLFFMH